MGGGDGKRCEVFVSVGKRRRKGELRRGARKRKKAPHRRVEYE